MNGLLDYFKTLNQPNQQGLTFVDRASMNPLLQAGIGILANNTGNYGEFAPALAKGMGYGLQNVMGYQQNKEDASIKKAQQDILKYDYETRRKKVEQEGLEDSAAENAAKGMFTALGFDPNNIAGEIGGFRPVSAGPQPIQSTPLPESYNLDITDFIPNVGGNKMMTSDIPVNTTPPQYKQNKIDALLNKWGWGPEEKDYFSAMAQTDPKGAEKYLRNEMFTRAKAAMASKRPDQRVGFEDAMILISEGVQVPGYEKYTPEIAGKYLGRKNEGRKAGAVNVEVGYPEDMIKFEGGLRKEFDDSIEAKAFPKVQAAYDQISFAAKNPSAANDLALATKFMKLLDPESVVRESELAMAMEASGSWDRLVNYHNRLLKGEKLTPSQRVDFMKSAEGLYEAAKNRYNQKAESYRSLAKDYKMNPDRIVRPVRNSGTPSVDDLLKKYGGK